MGIPRIYIAEPLATGRIIELPRQTAEHIVRVLRLEQGHAVRMFNGDGTEYRAEIVLIAKRSVTARVLELEDPVDRESRLRITLVQGVARGERMDWILQKATELGVARIVPLLTERTEVKLDADRAARRIAHWNGVLAAACEQCGRNRLPQLLHPIRLGEWVAGMIESAGELRLALDPQGGTSIGELPTAQCATLVVGPEGGLSAQDLASLDQAAFCRLRLGPRILRTETAGLAALSALQAIQGDFRRL